MLSPRQKLSLFVNSLGTFLISFFGVKITIILVKYILALSFGIETRLVGFRLMGISPAESGVWNFESVYAFYSAELVVSFLVFLGAFISFRMKFDQPPLRRAFYLWLGFSAIHSFCAGIISGVITKTNVFHFFHWLYIPYHILMLMAISLLPFMVLFGWFYNQQFLIATPINKADSKLKDQKMVLIYSMFLPLMAGALILMIPIIFTFHRYEFYEMAALFVLAVPVLFYFYRLPYYKHTQDFSKIIKYKRLILGLTGCAIFLAINLLRYF